MPARNSTAGDGDKHDGPDGPDPDVEARIGRKAEIGVKNKDTYDAEEKTDEDDVCRHVVDGKGKAPDGQDRCKVAEDEGADRPQDPAVLPARCR